MAEGQDPGQISRKESKQAGAAAGVRPAQENGENGAEPIEELPIYRRKRIVIPILLLLAIAGGGYWYYTHFIRGVVWTDDAMVDGNRVSISSKVLGRITYLAVDEGDSVKQGQVVVRLDASDLQAQQASSNAMLVSAQQNVALAKVNLDKAIDDFNRAQNQFSQNVIPREQFDHAQKALEAAKAQYNISNAQVGTAKAQLGVTTTQLQNMEIAAPMNGVVSKRWILVGDIAQPGQPIYSIYDIQHVWVIANFEETKLGVIHDGDPVEISIDAYPGVPFSGKVYQLGANTAAQFSLIPPNNASGNYTKVTQRVPIKISVQADRTQDRNLPLLPGMSVEVKLKENG